MTVDNAAPATGEPIEVRYDAQGTSLAGLVVDFGDGGVDSVFMQGAVTATGRLEHVYLEAGTFLVGGRLEEFGGDVLDKTLLIEVTDP